MPNAADRKSIRRQEKDARIAERQREEVITSIMSTASGRLWLWDHLSSAQCFHTTYVPGDALASAFQEGRRSLGLQLLSDVLRACPDQYIQAMKESNERNILERTRDDTDHAVPYDPHAERPGSTLPNGGDSGAESDQASDYDPTGYRSPGRDIYTEAP